MNQCLIVLAQTGLSILKSGDLSLEIVLRSGWRPVIDSEALKRNVDESTWKSSEESGSSKDTNKQASKIIYMRIEQFQSRYDSNIPFLVESDFCKDKEWRKSYYSK